MTPFVQTCFFVLVSMFCYSFFAIVMFRILVKKMALESASILSIFWPVMASYCLFKAFAVFYYRAINRFLDRLDPTLPKAKVVRRGTRVCGKEVFNGSTRQRIQCIKRYGHRGPCAWRP